MVIFKNKESWVERIAKGGYWAKAVEAERRGRLDEAIKFYLLDAAENSRKGRYLYSALSYLSAAKLAKESKKAKGLYKLAGDHYLKYARKVVNTSPASAVWGLRTAAKCYIKAGLMEEAEKCLKKVSALAERLGLEEVEGGPAVSPFRPYKGKGSEG